MTTAHKPTFHPAVGSQNMGGFRFVAPRVQVSVRDLNAYTTLKYRYARRQRCNFLDNLACMNINKFIRLLIFYHFICSTRLFKIDIAVSCILCCQHLLLISEPTATIDADAQAARDRQVCAENTENDFMCIYTTFQSVTCFAPM